MAQRKLIPIQPEFEVVPQDLSLVARDPLSRAVQRPHVPTRAQLMAERQAIQMEFQTERSKLAITKSMDVVDHGSAEATRSLVYLKHLQRGFAEGELTEEDLDFYDEMQNLIRDTSFAISAEAAQRLRQKARDLGLPSAEVSDLAVVIRWLQTH